MKTFAIILAVALCLSTYVEAKGGRGGGSSGGRASASSVKPSVPQAKPSSGSTFGGFLMGTAVWMMLFSGGKSNAHPTVAPASSPVKADEFFVLIP